MAALSLSGRAEKRAEVIALGVPVLLSRGPSLGLQSTHLGMGRGCYGPKLVQLLGNK